MLLFVVIASCMSGAFVCVLLRICMSPKTLEKFVLNAMDSSNCFHFI